MILITYVNPVCSFGFLSVCGSFSWICFLLKIQTCVRGNTTTLLKKGFLKERFEVHRKPPLTEIFLNLICGWQAYYHHRSGASFKKWRCYFSLNFVKIFQTAILWKTSEQLFKKQQQQKKKKMKPVPSVAMHFYFLQYKLQIS